MAHNGSHLSAFVPTQLREALEVSAREHDRSLSAELRWGLRFYLEAGDPSRGRRAAGSAVLAATAGPDRVERP
jgi:hypothetical protein